MYEGLFLFLAVSLGAKPHITLIHMEKYNKKTDSNKKPVLSLFTNNVEDEKKLIIAFITASSTGVCILITPYYLQYIYI